MGGHPGGGPDRRGFILGMTGALLASAFARASAGTAGLDLADSDEAFAAMLRMQGRLDGRDAPWWYFGRIYGVVGDASPRLLVRFEGLEIMRLTAVGEGEYAATGATTSFFQDPVSKQVLSRFDNPYTGRTNAVAPNLLAGTADPVAFYSKRGVRPARVSARDWSYAGQHLSWDFHGELVWLSHDRVYPPGLRQPAGESSVARARLADLGDRSRPFVPAGFSSTYFAPWPRWMEMGDRPGHVIWHADGVKLESVEALPASFMERMRREHPDRLMALPPA